MGAIGRRPSGSVGNIIGPGSWDDNSVLVADGDDSNAVKGTSVLIDDDDITGVGSITATTFTDGTASLTGGAITGLTQVNSVLAAELSQLESMGTTTISAAQWGYLGALDQSLTQASSPTFVGATLTGLTASRLVGSSAGSVLQSEDLASWVTGTANRLTVTDDTDGTITLTLPDTVSGLTSISATTVTDGTWSTTAGVHTGVASLAVTGTGAITFGAATTYLNQGAAGYLDAHFPDEDKGMRFYSAANHLLTISRLNTGNPTITKLYSPASSQFFVGASLVWYADGTVFAPVDPVLFQTAGSANVKLQDNGIIGFGTATNQFSTAVFDASIYYDGTNLIMDPSVVGSGTVRLPDTNGVTWRDSALKIHSPSDGNLQYDADGAHTFATGTVAIGTSVLSLSGVEYLIADVSPKLAWEETDAAADNKLWDMFVDSGGSWKFRVVNDANSAASNIMEVERTGTTVDSVSFPGSVLNATAVDLTGKLTISKAITPGGDWAFEIRDTQTVNGGIFFGEGASQADEFFPILRGVQEGAYAGRGGLVVSGQITNDEATATGVIFQGMTAGAVMSTGRLFAWRNFTTDQMIMTQAGHLQMVGTREVQFGTSTNYIYQPAADIMELSAASYVRIGAGTTTHSLGAAGDFLVSGVLEVNGLSYFDTDMLLLENGGDPTFYIGDTASAGDFGYIGWNSTGDYIVLGTQTGGDTLFVAETGFIGIDIVAPTRKLQLHEVSSSFSFLSFTNTTTGATINDGILVGLNSDEAGYFWHYESNPLIFGAGNLEGFRLQSDQNVLVAGTNQWQFRDADLRISSPADAILEVSADGYVRIGATATSHSLAGVGDFLVSGALEVDGQAWLDGRVLIDNATRSRLSFSESATAEAELIADYGYDQLLFALGAFSGRQLVLGMGEYALSDYDHASTGRPVLYVQSETDPGSDNTQYGSLYHDTTDFNLNIATGDFVLTCPANKTLKLTETVWDDFNFGAGQAQQPASGAPTTRTYTDNIGGDTDIATKGFAVGEKLSWTTEYLHRAKTDGDIYFHVHFQCDAAPTTTDYVKWQASYTITRDGTTCAPVTVAVVEVAIDTQYEQVRATFPIISGSGIQINDQIKVTLERIAAVGDAYAGEAKLCTFGVHVEIDALGSRTLDAK